MAYLMAKLHWYLVRLNDRVGWLGWLVLLLLIAIIMYGFYVLLPAQQHLDVLKLNPIKPVHTQQTVKKYQSPADLFFKGLPPVESVTSSIQTIFEAAEEQGIRIDEVIYKDKQKQGETALRYDMTFSVVAGYPDIKAFIIDALAELPWLALDQLTFDRDELDPNSVTTHLRFTMYVVK